MKQYPTAIGLGSVSLLNPLKMKAEGDQPVSPTMGSDTLADIQDIFSMGLNVHSNLLGLIGGGGVEVPMSYYLLATQSPPK